MIKCTCKKPCLQQLFGRHLPGFSFLRSLPKFSQFTVCCCVLFLAGCSTAGFQQADQAQIIGDSSNVIVDIAAKMMVSPSSNSQLTYSETDSFDIALLSSMKGGTSPIAVQMDGQITKAQLSDNQAISTMTPRIERWTYKVTSTGGQLVACKDPAPEYWGLIVSIAVGLFGNMIEDYVTYRPAKNYDAKIVYNPETDKVKHVDFYVRTEGEFSCDSH